MNSMYICTCSKEKCKISCPNKYSWYLFCSTPTFDIDPLASLPRPRDEEFMLACQCKSPAVKPDDISSFMSIRHFSQNRYEIPRIHTATLYCSFTESPVNFRGHLGRNWQKLSLFRCVSISSRRSVVRQVGQTWWMGRCTRCNSPRRGQNEGSEILAGRLTRWISPNLPGLQIF